MIRLASILAAILLAISLALTSISMDRARGGMRLSAPMILCPAGAQVTANHDPDRQPQGQQAPACPECTMGALILIGMAPPAVSLGHGTPVQVARITPAPYLASILAAQARGPPRLI